MKIRRIDSRCYATVITEDGQWQKGEVNTRKYTYRYNNQGNWIEKRIPNDWHFLGHLLDLGRYYE